MDFRAMAEKQVRRYFGVTSNYDGTPLMELFVESIRAAYSQGVEDAINILDKSSCYCGEGDGCCGGKHLIDDMEALKPPSEK